MSKQPALSSNIIDFNLRQKADAFIREHDAEHLHYDLAYHMRVCLCLYEISADQPKVITTARQAIVQKMMETDRDWKSFETLVNEEYVEVLK